MACHPRTRRPSASHRHRQRARLWRGASVHHLRDRYASSCSSCIGASLCNKKLLTDWILLCCQSNSSNDDRNDLPQRREEDRRPAALPIKEGGDRRRGPRPARRFDREVGQAPRELRRQSGNSAEAAAGHLPGRRCFGVVLWRPRAMRPSRARRGGTSSHVSCYSQCSC